MRDKVYTIVLIVIWGLIALMLFNSIWCLFSDYEKDNQEFIFAHSYVIDENLFKTKDFSFLEFLLLGKPDRTFIVDLNGKPKEIDLKRLELMKYSGDTFRLDEFNGLKYTKKNYYTLFIPEEKFNGFISKHDLFSNLNYIIIY